MSKVYIKKEDAFRIALEGYDESDTWYEISTPEVNKPYSGRGGIKFIFTEEGEYKVISQPYIRFRAENDQKAISKVKEMYGIFSKDIEFVIY